MAHEVAVRSERPGGAFRVVTRTIDELVEVMPGWAKALIAALAALALALAAGASLVALNNRRIGHQRRLMADDVDALAAAVLPDVPRRVGALLTSVAHQLDASPAAGGSFCDVFPLAAGRAGAVLGAVAGHGRDAIADATRLRHALRAFLEAEPIPRRAIQTADRVVADDLVGGPATVVVAVHDRRTGTLTYACAGHSPPVLVGPPEHLPVLTAAAPPVGGGELTGMRQTTISFPAGSLACFLSEVSADQPMLSHERLAEVAAELGPLATARRVLGAVADAADAVPDDVAVCILRPLGPKAGPSHRVEELELTPDEVDAGIAAQFLRGCGLGEFTVEHYDSLARRTVHRYGGATGIVVRVRVGGDRTRVEILVAGRQWPYAPAPAALADDVPISWVELRKPNSTSEALRRPLAGP